MHNILRDAHVYTLLGLGFLALQPRLNLPNVESSTTDHHIRRSFYNWTVSEQESMFTERHKLNVYVFSGRPKKERLRVFLLKRVVLINPRDCSGIWAVFGGGGGTYVDTVWLHRQRRLLVFSSPNYPPCSNR